MYEVFSFVDGQFKTPLENFISTGTSNIANWVSGPLTAALTLYVVLYGYLVLRGSVQEPILEFAFRAIKLAIIVMLVRNASDYQTYVTNIFFDTLPKEIAEALNSGKTERDHDHQKLRKRCRIDHEQDCSDPWVRRSPQDDTRPAITEGRIHAEEHMINRRKSDRQKHVVKNGRDKRKQDEQSA